MKESTNTVSRTLRIEIAAEFHCFLESIETFLEAYVMHPTGAKEEEQHAAYELIQMGKQARERMKLSEKPNLDSPYLMIEREHFLRTLSVIFNALTWLSLSEENGIEEQEGTAIYNICEIGKAIVKELKK